MLAKLCQDKGNSRTKHWPLTTIPHLDSWHFLLKCTSTPSIVTITLKELQTWTCWEFSSCCIFHRMMSEPWEIQHHMHKRMLFTTTSCLWVNLESRFGSLYSRLLHFMLERCRVCCSLQHVQYKGPDSGPDQVILHALAINAVGSIGSKLNSTSSRRIWRHSTKIKPSIHINATREAPTLRGHPLKENRVFSTHGHAYIHKV